jgi:hypothetical protein
LSTGYVNTLKLSRLHCSNDHNTYVKHYIFVFWGYKGVTVRKVGNVLAPFLWLQDPRPWHRSTNCCNTHGTARRGSMGAVRTVRAITHHDTALLANTAICFSCLISVHLQGRLGLTTWGGVQAPGFHERPPVGRTLHRCWHCILRVSPTHTYTNMVHTREPGSHRLGLGSDCEWGPIPIGIASKPYVLSVQCQILTHMQLVKSSCIIIVMWCPWRTFDVQFNV